MLKADDAAIIEFLRAWPAPQGRQVRAKQRRAYIAIDHDNGPGSWSGYFLVDRLTHAVYRTKGYGVKGSYCGTLESLTMRFREKGAPVMTTVSKLPPMSKVSDGIRERGHLAMNEIGAPSLDLDDVWAFVVRFAQSEVDRLKEAA